MNTTIQKNNFDSMDGWGDEPVTDVLDDSLWDDYDTLEDDSDYYENESDLQALECELDDALSRRDMDRVDDVQDSLCQLYKLPQKSQRKTHWKPPPQVSMVKKQDEKDFKPVSKSWILPVVVVDKTNPSVASSLRPQKAKRCRVDGPAPRKQFAKSQSTGVATTTFEIKQTPWKQFKSEERRKYWQQKKQIASQSRDKKAQELVRRNEARESAFDKLENKTTEGSLKTQPCKSIMSGRQCRFGHKCKFAHTPQELTVRQCHFKSQCRHKHKCKFAHPCDHQQKTDAARAEMARMLR